jgi:TRAP-type C4-dicarboxylate transport system permease small subunit
MKLLKNILIKIPALLLFTVIVVGWMSFSLSNLNVYAQTNQFTIGSPSINNTLNNAAGINTGSCGGGILASFQILPFCSIYDLLNAVVGFLVTLSGPLALLVITWGGYQYFASGFEGKTNGLKAIKAGVIGLAIILSANFIIAITQTTFTAQGFSADGILNQILSPARTTLVTLSSAVALLVITWGGYRYFVGGIDGKTEGAKNIQSGITGLIIVLLANFIVEAVNNVFKDANASTDFGDKAKNFIEPILTQGLSFLTSLASIAAVLVIVWGGYKYFFSTLPGSKEDGKKNIERGIVGLVVVIIAQPIVTIVNSTIGVQNNQLSLDPQSLIFTAQVIITNFLIPISSVITVGLFIWAGYLWITSAGDAGTVKKAKDSFFNAIIGLIVVLLAVTITQLVVFFVQPADSSAPASTTNNSSSNTTTSTSNNSSTTTTTARPTLSTGTSSPTTINSSDLGSNGGASERGTANTTPNGSTNPIAPASPAAN